MSVLRSLPAQMPPPSPPRASPAPPSIVTKSRVAHASKLMFWWLRLHAVSACASTPPLSNERGSAAATVMRLSCLAPSAVPPCPAQPTPPLDRSGVGSTPATIYPRTRAQHFSCPWRCERARRCNRFARGARRCNRYARGAWRREGRGPALRGRLEGRGPALELGR
jgi:hypothetical protein